MRSNNVSSMGNMIGLPLRSVLSLKCNSLFESGCGNNALCHQWRKMLEILDSLNERGMTNKRHLIQTWIRTGTSNACRDQLGLFGDRKYRAKIWTILEPWIVGDGDGISASSVIDSGNDGDSVRETAPGRSADWTDVTRRRSGSWMEIRGKRTCRSARLNSWTYAIRTCTDTSDEMKTQELSVAFFLDNYFILYRESQFARIC